jgi:hypothetical protein
MRAGEVQQLPSAGPIGGHGDLPKQATNGGEGRCGQGVAVGVDADNPIHLVSQQPHGCSSFQLDIGHAGLEGHHPANL